MDEDTLEILTTDNEKLAVSEKTLEYHRKLKEQVKEIYEIAEKAKQVGYDPKKEVEIYLAQSAATRTEGLVGPPGVAKRLVEMEEVEKLSKDKIVIKIAKEIAAGKLKQGSVEELADQALRTALSYQTESITAAPIEGIGKVILKNNPDNTQYLAVYYSGPIRSAGGTAQGVSIYIADEIRKTLGLARYKAPENEVERMLEEVRLYNKIMHLQLPTSDDEIRHAWRNIPIMVTGDATEDEEVSGYRNIESMDTNRVRGGACLVLNDGLVGRAKKITKRTKKLGLEGWEWLEEIAAGKYSDKRETESKGEGSEKPTKALPDYSFASDALMGRPTFSDATAIGGFRLRYGHSRHTGIAGIGVHPGTMAAVDDFLAPGTHVRTERPGKGSIVVAIDTIKPPIVKLKNGDVIELHNYETGKKVQRDIAEILFIGDMLVGVGEFIQNNYRLTPPGYNPEWWALELIAAGWEGNKEYDHEIKFFTHLYRNPPDYEEAKQLSLQYDVALHPRYTPAWIYLTVEEVMELRTVIKNISGTHLDISVKPILEKALIPHKIIGDKLDIEILGPPLKDQLHLEKELVGTFEDGLQAVQSISILKIRDLIGTTIGARMGRPEKAKARLMKPKLHGLFPVGEEKRIHKELGKALEYNMINVKLSHRVCKDCNIEQFQQYCQRCGEETKLIGKCINSRCGRINDIGPCDSCGRRVGYTKHYKFSLQDYIKKTRRRVGTLPKQVKLKDQLNNPTGIPELIDKGILRAEFDLNVFRDGSIRYDATDAPLTHFYPYEIRTSIPKLIEMGYTHDIYGAPLTSENQLLELKVQDIIIHESAIDHLINVSRFVDNELERIYKMDRFYDIKKVDDLYGQLVIGLAPHTSAGVIGRVVGFTKSSVCWAHPFWHSSKRRNCLVGNEQTLLYDEKGEIKIFQMKELENIDLHSYKAVSFNRDGILEKRDIKELVKIPAPPKLLRIHTTAGREITVTENHKMMRVDGNIISEVESKDLNVDDQLLSLAKLQLGQSMEDINVIKYYTGTNNAESSELRIENLSPSIVNQIDAQRTWDSFTQPLDVAPNGSQLQVFDVDTIPLYILIDVLKKIEIDLSNSKISYPEEKSSIPSVIKLTRDLGEIVGLHLSSGFVRQIDNKDRKSCVYQIVWSVADMHYAMRIVKIIKTIFHTAPSKIIKSDDSIDIVLNGHVFYDFFVSILGLRVGYSDKTLTNLLQTPNDFKKGLLAGYIEGNGSVDQSVIISSHNKNLLNQLSLIAIDLGLKPHYGQLNNSTQKCIYKLEFYSQDLLFLKKIMVNNKRESLVTFLQNTELENIESKTFLDSNFDIDKIKEIEEITDHNHQFVYDFVLEGEKTFVAGQGWFGTYDCDGDEDGIILLMDGLLNFSKEFLPTTRGSKMDTPLVLVVTLNPNEVDDEAFNLDCMTNYTLDFYNAAINMEIPSTLSKKILRAEQRLGTPGQYEGFVFSHDTRDISEGPLITRYKDSSLKIRDKLDDQLRLAKRIRAVNASDTALRILEKHALPDLQGNLRAFASQKVRCVTCNAKYRRVPLSGKCNNPKCESSNIILTVPPKGVSKYFDICEKLVYEFNLGTYHENRLARIKLALDSLFPEDTVEMMDLSEWF